MGYWDNAKKNAVVASNHTKDMARKYSNEILASFKLSCIYTRSLTPSEPKEQAVFKLINTDSVDAILSLAPKKRAAVLNFASFKEAGGKFLEGSMAQEECLCHTSFLYNVLREFEPSYYAVNRKQLNRALYHNTALYTPLILFKDDKRERWCDVITCAAPNWTTANKYCHVSPDENLQALTSRIEFVKNISLDNDLDTVILGAYGCGVFGQDPNVVARLIKDIFEFSGLEVILAVPGNNNNYKAFKQVFG